MSANDPIAAMLGRLDGPVQPRAEFAESLLASLLAELAGGAAPARRPARRAVRLPRILPGAPPRLRLALIVIALLLLLAAIATATYLGVKEWVSTAPRGVQVTSDYRITTVFRDAPQDRFWPAFALGPDGKDLYGLRQPPRHPQRRAELMRFPGVVSAAGPVEPERVLSLDSLSDRPRLWDPGTQLGHTVVGPYVGGHLEGGGRADPLAAAENGDLFLVAGVWPERDEFHWLAPPASASVIVRHGDGSLEKVLTLRELVREALPGTKEENVELEIAASEPGRVWVKARVGEPSAPQASLGRYRVFEVVDPNGDGGWDDRTVRRISLPDSIPTADFDRRGLQRTAITQIEAEPNSRAFVLTAAAESKGRFRIFRVDDRNGDGDANDANEVSVPLDRSGARFGSDFGAEPSVSVRGGEEGGLVVARLTRPTRLTVLSRSGEETDIGRSFHVIEDVLSGPGGDIYVVRQVPGSPPCCRWIGYRLTPIEGQRNATAATTPATAVPRAIPLDDVPRIAFTLESADGERGRIGTVRADDRGGFRQLVPGRFNHGFCQSANGKRLAYFSDAEAPHEPFIYVANADGSNRRKVTEEDAGFWCLFSDRWLLLTKEAGRAMTLIRHDLRTGADKGLVRNVDRFALSPDGNTILFVGGLDFGDGPGPADRETLELLNMNTLERRRLTGGPLARGSYSELTWSPDGRRIGYTIRPSANATKAGAVDAKAPPRRRVLEVRDTRSGALAVRLRMSGGLPTVRWSPDSTRLLVCVPARRTERGCSDGLPQTRPSARLLIVNVSTGGRRQVARGGLLWADWSPTGGYGYATTHAVFVVSPDGDVAKLPNGPRRTRAGQWLGFSPDGRYIGLGDFASRIGVIDLRSRKLRVLLRERQGREFFLYRKWLR